MKRILALLLVTVLILAGCSAKPTADPTEATPGETAPSAAQPEESTEAANTMPDFTAYDLDGNPVSLSDYFGKPIVVNFWATWCGPCVGELPEFEAVYQEHGDEVQFLMVNMTAMSETKENAVAFVDKEGYTFPVLLDLDGSAMNAYGINAIPVTLFIDANGVGVAQATGAINAATLEKGINMIR